MAIDAGDFAGWLWMYLYISAASIECQAQEGRGAFE